MNEIRINKTRFLIALTVVFLAAATIGFAHEVEERHKIKIKIDDASETLEIDDMEVGETRQFFTDSGKEVVVTREEQGYELSVDGREIDIFSPDHHGVSVVRLDGEDGEGTFDVVLKKVFGAGDEGENVFFVSGDEDDHEHGEHEVFVWSSAEGAEKSHSFSYQVKIQDVATRVLESGVLDKLDEATRQEILDEIKKAEGHRRVFRSGASAVVIDDDEIEN